MVFRFNFSRHNKKDMVTNFCTRFYWFPDSVLLPFTVFLDSFKAESIYQQVSH
uniref:Uncharacterized protein n=1 Tax=Physcomitrium patens TaxID=3218 RepID=A0A7I4EX74_PHYPA